MAFTIVCPLLFADAQSGGGDIPQVNHVVVPGNHGPNCQKIRVQSAPYNSKGGNDTVVYCPAEFPWVMHCGTHGNEAGVDKTDISSKCDNSGKCSGIGLRKNTGPQNQAIEIVEKNATKHVGCTQKVTGCWVYDWDHVHLPYTTEVVCCR
jgi:hypothetical protein